MRREELSNNEVIIGCKNFSRNRERTLELQNHLTGVQTGLKSGICIEKKKALKVEDHKQSKEVFEQRERGRVARGSLVAALDPSCSVFSKRTESGPEKPNQPGDHSAAAPAPGARPVSPVASQLPAVVLAAGSARASAQGAVTARCPPVLSRPLRASPGLGARRGVHG